MHQIHQGCPMSGPRANTGLVLRWQTGLRLTGPEPRRFPVASREPPATITARWDNLASGAGWQRGDSSLDRIQKWGALVGRRNIAYVIFSFSAAPLWHGDGGSGSTRS